MLNVQTETFRQNISIIHILMDTQTPLHIQFGCSVHFFICYRNDQRQLQTISCVRNDEFTLVGQITINFISKFY